MRTLVSILWWLLLLALPSPAALRAQQPVITFQHLSVEEGLPERNVYRIFQDHLGFMWFGTANGVIRYDGYTFTHYKPDPEDPYSLTGRLIMSITEDRAGALWIGTLGGGLNRYDRQWDRFLHYRRDPHDPSSLSVDIVGALHEDHDGVLWVGTGSFEVPGGAGGLHRYDRSSGTFTRFEHDPDDPTSLSPGAVSAILEDSDGALWVATAGGGLNRCDRRIDRCVRLRHDPDDPGTLSEDHLTVLHEDRAGQLWVGTWNAGLNRLDRSSGRATRYRHDPADPGSLTSDRVFAVHEDRDGRLWVGTGGGVLHRFDPAADAFVHYRHDPQDPGSLSDNIAIWSIYEDRTGTVWFATRGSGVDRLDRFTSELIRYAHDPENPDSLSDHRVRAVLEDRDGRLWVGTRRGGLNRIDPASGRVTHFRYRPGSPGSLRSDWIFAIHQGPSGILWVGTRDGLSRFDPATESFTHFVHDPDDPTSLSENRVRTVLEEASGVLWVGTVGGGLNRLDPRTGKFTHYRNRPGDARSLGTDIVVALCQDRYGTLWIGGEGSGLQRFHPETETFTRYYDPDIGLEFVTTIHEDRGGRLWVGTFNGGLHLFDRETAARRYFTERDGLPNDGVFHILEDDDGRLWLTTFNGLSVFDPRQEFFVNYDHTDGLRADWHTGGAFKSPRGTLYFGGSTGLYAISPGDLVHNPHPPQVVLTDLRIGNQPGEIGPQGPLRQHISVAKEIRLRHHENVISLEFAALHYSYPAGNQYAYRMFPFDAEEWRLVGTRRWVTYTQLPPGRYTFQVKAASSDGVWNEDGVAVRITVAPPWWRTWWAFVGYLMLLGAVLYGTERILHARVVHREREKAQLLEARFRAETAELEVKAAAAETRVLQLEVARQTRELEEARQLQLSMLPAEVPQHPALAIAAGMTTAAEVGGDYYDFDLADDGTLTVAIGDATGHGSRAGTMVTAAKSLFNVLAREPDVVEALRQSTNAIKRMKLRKLHMALMLAKFRDGRLTLANAGMPPVLIYRAASVRVEEIDLAGVPLGSFLSFPYEQKTVELAPGDTVVMMSDGFPEMVNPHGEMFGYERLDPLLRVVAERSPDEIIRHFADTAAEWAAGRPQDDDMTFVVMKVKPSDESTSPSCNAGAQ